MKKLVIVVIVLVILAAIVGGLAYADLRLRGLVQEHAEVKITEAVPQAQGVHVTVDGFPFTLGVLLRGEVEALHVKIDAVEEQGLRATDLRLDVEDIVLDKDALIDQQRLVVTDIGQATMQGVISDDAVSEVVGHEVVFEVGMARTEFRGRTIDVEVSVQGRRVMLASNLPRVPPMTFPLPSSDMIPCAPELELLEGKMRLACSVDELPPRLEQAMAAQ